MARAPQSLHLVLGGELDSLRSTRFKDPGALHIVGVYTSYDKALESWQTAARATIDNAHMRYFIVPLHELLDPRRDRAKPARSAKPKPGKKRAAPQKG